MAALPRPSAELLSFVEQGALALDVVLYGATVAQLGEAPSLTRLHVALLRASVPSVVEVNPNYTPARVHIYRIVET